MKHAACKESWVSTIQTIVLTADVFQLFILRSKHFLQNAKCVRRKARVDFRYSAGENGFQASCSNASPYPVQTRSVGTIAAITTCCLCTTWYTAALCSTWHYIALLLLWCIMCNTTNIEATKKCRASRSDIWPLQQQCSSIMMHPSGHPAARRQRRSHAPILSRQPRSTRRYAGRCGSGWWPAWMEYAEVSRLVAHLVFRFQVINSW